MYFMKVTYQDWHYDACNQLDKIEFKVYPSPVLENKPDSFFKYFALSDNSVEALTQCYIYASHPNQFNDSIDCSSQLLGFNNATNVELRSLYNGFYNSFLTLYGDEQTLREHTSEVFKTLAYRHIGIVCLTDNNCNAHLWHEYASDGAGFSVEFDVEKFPFRKHGPFPMHYVDKIEPFQVKNNMPIALLIQTNVKTKDWMNENEWRLLVSNPEGLDYNSWEDGGVFSQQYNLGDEHDRRMRYPFSAIKCVTLGERFFKAPSIRCYPISNDENEYVFLSDREELRCRVLDFLIGRPFGKYIITNNLGRLYATSMEIVKLQERVYRIILNNY